MGVVDDGDEKFSFLVELARGGDETVFAFVVVAVGFEVEGEAEEAEDVVPTVEGTINDGDDPVSRVVFEEVLFEDGFSGARFTEYEAKAALLGVDLEDVEVTLLVF